MNEFVEDTCTCICVCFAIVHVSEWNTCMYGQHFDMKLRKQSCEHVVIWRKKNRKKRRKKVVYVFLKGLINFETRHGGLFFVCLCQLETESHGERIDTTFRILSSAEVGSNVFVLIHRPIDLSSAIFFQISRRPSPSKHGVQWLPVAWRPRSLPHVAVSIATIFISRFIRL